MEYWWTVISRQRTLVCGRPVFVLSTTIRTLTRQKQLVFHSPDSLQDETDYLNNVFSKNNYNTDFVRRNTHSNTDSNSQTNSGPVTTATIPHIRVTAEAIARTLPPYNIRVAHKPIGWFSKQNRNVIWRRESARKGLNSTSVAQFAAVPLVAPVVWFARAVVNWRSRSVAKSA